VARLHREKTSVLLDRIAAGGFVEGQLLPLEVDLAAELDVSRGVAREVVRALEERGVVSVRHGLGATVNGADDWNLLDREVMSAALAGPHGKRLMLELTECRRLLEPGTARLAAERATAEQRDRIERALARLATAPAHDRAARGSSELAVHRAIVAASGNRPLAATLRPLLDGLDVAAAGVFGRRAESEPEHRRLVEAISAGDPGGAENAMRMHLDGLADSLSAARRRRVQA
jgi:GntR family transcriptional repressor for pyruvate dehydrogenase complex